MSNHGSNPTFTLNHQASTSTNPHQTMPASYHPQPRPPSAPPLQRVDIHGIKQELHDALGEQGLPYWKALNGYLLGQLGRGELQDMVKGWLKGKKVHLHNRLLVSLLHNASATPSSAGTPTLGRKRKRVGVDDPEFDTDDTFIEPKARVHQWVVGMSSRERARVRRAVMGRANEMEVEGDEEELGSWGDGRKRRWSSFQPNTAMPPLALSSRLLPSSHQLSHRLAQMAKAYDLTLAHDAFADIGDFMAVGMDAHLGDILHGIVHLTGRERPGEDTIRVPKGVKLEPEDHMEVDGGPSIKQEPNGDMPKPDLETFQSLFIMAPNLHPQASPAVYKLQTSQTLSEVEYKRPVKFERKSSPPPSPRIGDITVSGSPKNSAVNAGNKVEMVTKNLLETGLLKLDKAGRHSEAGEPEGKKERKHNLHWKYEDPALILKDLLG